ncbi:MAG: RING finger domain-containing protein [Nitrososphaerota archaeon]
MAVEVSEERVLARFFKIGSILSLVASLHMLSLLLPWYETITDTVAQSRIAGYIPAETLILSVAGGILAGLALVSSSLSKSVGTVRGVLMGMGFAGGLVALVSPIYLMTVIVPRLNITGRLELGFFAALFTGIALLGVSGVAAATRVRLHRAYPYGYTPIPSPSDMGITYRGETSFVAVESVEEGIKCPICYLEVEAEGAVRCSSCGVIYHSGCVDTWVELNKTCPNCQKTVV